MYPIKQVARISITLIVFFSSLTFASNQPYVGQVKTLAEETSTTTAKNVVESTTETVTETTVETASTQKGTTEKETTTEEETSKTANTYTDYELYLLSHLIYGEASGCSYEHKMYVGSVVLNRVGNSNYPDTIEDVVYQKGQYACTWDGNFDKEPDNETVEIAEYLLKNGSQIPEGVVYQAEFKQGSGVWLKSGNTYFCYR